MQLLIAHGADINIAGSHDFSSPLHVCARRGDLDGLNLLLECSNVNLLLKDKDGMTPVEVAKAKVINQSITHHFIICNVCILVKLTINNKCVRLSLYT